MTLSNSTWSTHAQYTNTHIGFLLFSVKQNQQLWLFTSGITTLSRCAVSISGKYLKKQQNAQNISFTMEYKQKGGKKYYKGKFTHSKIWIDAMQSFHLDHKTMCLQLWRWAKIIVLASKSRQFCICNSLIYWAFFQSGRDRRISVLTAIKILTLSLSHVTFNSSYSFHSLFSA